MGDVLSLVEEVERSVDKAQAERMAGKLKKGKGFDLEDMREQLQQVTKMGGVGGLMDKLPGMGKMTEQVNQQMNDGQLRRQIAIINSMTPGERRKPEVINGHVNAVSPPAVVCRCRMSIVCSNSINRCRR